MHSKSEVLQHMCHAAAEVASNSTEELIAALVSLVK